MPPFLVALSEVAERSTIIHLLAEALWLYVGKLNLKVASIGEKLDLSTPILVALSEVADKESFCSWWVYSGNLKRVRLGLYLANHCRLV